MRAPLLVRKTGLFPRHVSSRQGLAEIRWGLSKHGAASAGDCLQKTPSAELCGGRAHITTEMAMRANRPTRRALALRREREARGDDSLPTLGQAWLRE